MFALRSVFMLACLIVYILGISTGYFICVDNKTRAEVMLQQQEEHRMVELRKLIKTYIDDLELKKAECKK